MWMYGRESTNMQMHPILIVNLVIFICIVKGNV